MCIPHLHRFYLLVLSPTNKKCPVYSRIICINCIWSYLNRKNTCQNITNSFYLPLKMQQQLHFSYHDFNHLFILIAYPPSFFGDGLSPLLHMLHRYMESLFLLDSLHFSSFISKISWRCSFGFKLDNILFVLVFAPHPTCDFWHYTLGSSSSDRLLQTRSHSLCRL